LKKGNQPFDQLEFTQIYTRVTINDLKQIQAKYHPDEQEKGWIDIAKFMGKYGYFYGYVQGKPMLNPFIKITIWPGQGHPVCHWYKITECPQTS
ncbi:MAG: hypothetical protein KKE44_22605, partial [Proteobacteria bacterium]|nr:hypothetical protein [Pseudomonadota bacterium]MBU1585524.1 hypothetical protein [Pseudomonadota bacterium]